MGLSAYHKSDILFFSIMRLQFGRSLLAVSWENMNFIFFRATGGSNGGQKRMMDRNETNVVQLVQFVSI